MNKRLVASVLLAGMTVAFPVYADGDRTPDELDNDTKYESPLDLPDPIIVNDYRKQKMPDGNDVFMETAGRFAGGPASGKVQALDQNMPDGLVIVSDAEKKQTEEAQRKTEENSRIRSEKTSEERAEVQKAQKLAEEELTETDENFEPVAEVTYPGREYQARRQIKAIADKETAEESVRLANANSGTAKPEDPAIKEMSTGSRDVPATGGENVPANTVRPVSSLANQQPIPAKQRPAAVNRQTSLVSPRSGSKKQKPAGTNSQNPPLVITGDDAQYASDSGDFIIEGNVKLEQGVTKLFSTKAVGNEKTGDIWLLEGGTMVEPTNTVAARWAHYNYDKETGELLHLKGAANKGENSVKKDYYEAPHGIIENGMLIIDQGGTTTRCPAIRHSSCLSVKAKNITIIPNQRIIARGVQVFAKGKHIYSRDVWINDLQQSNNRLMPHVGWNNDKGFYIALDYEQPIGNPLLKNSTKIFTHQVYYTKSRYKPFYGIRHDQPDFYVRLHHGYVYDSDNDEIDEGIWLKKKMDWGLFWKPHRLAKGLPLSYDGYITHGLWQYTNRDWSSWHTEKVIRLQHDRLYPLGGKKLYMDLMVGHKWVNESNGTATFGTRKYGKNLDTNILHGTLGYRFSNKWNIWTSYHKEHKTSFNFSKGQPSFYKGWRNGISWSPDAHNTFVLVNTRNLDSDTRDSGLSTHGNYSTVLRWSHRFCCEVLKVTYEKKHYKNEHEWTVEMEFLNW